MLILFTSLISFLITRSFTGFFFLLWLSILLFSYLLFDAELSFSLFSLDLGLIEFTLMLDDLGMWFAGLTSICCVWLLLSLYNKHSFNRVVDILILYIFLCSMIFFLCGELLVLYTSFELTTIPILLFVGLLGVSARRVYAISVMIIYMLFSSAIMGLILFLYLDELFDSQHLYLAVLRSSYSIDSWAFTAFILVFFGVKVPAFPFYLWLPEAHVESNTELSILLASIILKFGAFGLVRVCYWLDTDHAHSISWIAVSICLIGLIHSSVSSIQHLDMKKLIAYSSIVHMQFSLIGLFANDQVGLQIAMLGLLVHGIVSIGLFYTIGVVSESIGTRHIAFVHAGLSLTPMLAWFGFVTVMLNISVPLSLGAIVEFLTLTIYKEFGTVTLILAAICAIWFCTLFSLLLLYRTFMNDSSFYNSDTVDLSLPEVLFLTLSYSLLAITIFLV